MLNSFNLHSSRTLEDGTTHSNGYTHLLHYLPTFLFIPTKKYYEKGSSYICIVFKCDFSNISSSAFADPKPLASITLRPLGGSKALPPIGSSGLSALSSDLEEKRRAAEETLRKSQKQLVDQRKQEEELRSHLNQVDPEEADRRARHMREQRDRIIAQKKAERERKVREEEEAQRKMADEIPEAVLRAQARADLEAKQNDTAASSSSSVSEDEVERKRAAMRTALARRMKLDLIESEEQKLAQLQEEQFADLDKKLRQVEQLRSDNKKREAILAEQLRKQQANIARNVQRSAAALRDEDA